MGIQDCNWPCDLPLNLVLSANKNVKAFSYKFGEQDHFYSAQIYAVLCSREDWTIEFVC